MEEVARECPAGASVFVLTRYNFTAQDTTLTNIRRRHPNLRVTHLTAHRSKGLEADYVVIVDLAKGKHGFPTMISDDPLVEMVLAEPDGYPYSEERRLFYVAITRARKGVYLCAPVNRPSSFVTELLDWEYLVTSQVVGAEGEIADSLLERRCPACETGHLVPRSSEYGSFLGCSNFPYCTHKVNGRTAAQ